MNKIIEESNKKEELQTFIGRKRPGLQDKSLWLYFKLNPNGYDHNYQGEIKNKKEHIQILNKKFQGFGALYSFRNDIAHGKIDEIYLDFLVVQKLRNCAKDIVDNMYQISSSAGQMITRDIYHDDVYNSY